MADDSEFHANFERSGENTGRWGKFSLDIVENTVDLGSLEEIVRNLQPEFTWVEIRRHVAGPMASGPFGDVALVLAFAIASQGFFSELGKDAYQALRRAIHTAYLKVRTRANDRRYDPFDIRISYGSGPVVIFRFPDGLPLESFETALAAIPLALPTIDRSAATVVVTMYFSVPTNSWVLGGVD